MRILLDDDRNPTDAANQDGKWTIVRGVAELFALIQKVDSNSITEISFDHDLGQNNPTGMDAVKTLVEMAMDHPEKWKNLKRIQLHSANVDGILNMKMYLLSAQKHGILPGVEILMRSVLHHPGMFVQ